MGGLFFSYNIRSQCRRQNDRGYNPKSEFFKFILKKTKANKKKNDRDMRAACTHSVVSLFFLLAFVFHKKT